VSAIPADVVRLLVFAASSARGAATTYPGALRNNSTRRIGEPKARLREKDLHWEPNRGDPCSFSVARSVPQHLSSCLSEPSSPSGTVSPVLKDERPGRTRSAAARSARLMLRPSARALKRGTVSRVGGIEPRRLRMNRGVFGTESPAPGATGPTAPGELFAPEGICPALRTTCCRHSTSVMSVVSRTRRCRRPRPALT